MKRILLMRARALCMAWIIAAIALAAPPEAGASTTLDKIKAADSLACGVNIEEPEYSTEDAHGNHSAFDQDICKAVAVAVLGNHAKFIVKFYRDERDAFKALKAGEIALLATGSPDYLHATNEGFGFSRPVFYDYQGFLVNKSMGIHTARDLARKKVCFLGGTEIEIQLQGFMKRENIHWLPFAFQEEGEMEAALITGNCAAISADVSQLSYERIAFKSLANNFEILPDIVAKDPLAVACRSDDAQWAAIINWTVEALIQAEESGVTQANVAAMAKSDDPVLQRLLGVLHGYGQSLGLEDNWAARVIEAVGNYGEIYQRDLGSGSPMKLPRGLNNLWTHGGLMMAAPIR